jgi:hypothetical protein
MLGTSFISYILKYLWIVKDTQIFQVAKFSNESVSFFLQKMLYFWFCTQVLSGKLNFFISYDVRSEAEMCLVLVCDSVTTFLSPDRFCKLQ